MNLTWAGAFLGVSKLGAIDVRSYGDLAPWGTAQPDAEPALPDRLGQEARRMRAPLNWFSANALLLPKVDYATLFLQR